MQICYLSPHDLPRESCTILDHRRINFQRKLQNLLNLIGKVKINYFIIGNGTNVLITDKGFRGIIIKLKFPK